MKQSIKYFFFATMLLVLAVPQGFAQTKEVKVAFLRVDNSNRDPRYDYLSGMISGVLLYDLSRTEGITIVDRRSLDDVLKEQELSVSDLSQKDEVKIGKILGAQHLIRAGFVYLGDEVMVNITLVNVESSKTIVLSRRGRSENIIHTLAEDLVVHLTGQETVFQSKESDRSIISMKDEKPGSLDLYCNLIRGEIYFDNEFTGYTTGKSTVPFKIEGIKPGKHTVRIVLGGFGEIKLPEITFHDWERTIDVLPGKNHVLKAVVINFNSKMYDIIDLFRESQTFYIGTREVFQNEYDNSFTDRKGTPIHTVVKIESSQKDKILTTMVEFVYNGEKKSVTLICNPGEKKEQTIEMGITKLYIENNFNSPFNGKFIVDLSRTDAKTNEWQK